MEPDVKTNLELRLEKIESYLSSIARMRSIQLRNRKILLISLGIIVAALVIVELTCNADTDQPVFVLLRSY